LPRVWEGIQSFILPVQTPASSHWGETIHLYCVWEKFQ